MLEIRQGIFLSTALTMSLFCGAARASEAPIVNEKPASATDKAAVDIEVQHSSAPVPGNAPIQLFTPLASKIIGPGIPDDSLNTQFPPESDEAIKRANELHAQAVEQLKKDDFVQAIKLDEEASKVAPHYWLPHVALAYLYSNYRGGGPALEQATMAVRCQHTGMADNTYATMISAMHAFAPAMEKYKQLVAADPTSWRAKVGLASCYLSKNDPKSANALLDEMNNAGVKDPSALLVMGSFYKKSNELEKAKEVLKRGLDNNPEPKIKDKLLVQLFEIAVATNDRPLISELKSKVSPVLDARQRAWLRTGNVKLAKTPAEAKLALQLAETETVLDSEYRGYARIFDAMAKANPTDQAAWLKLSKEALTQALAAKPADLQNKTLLASIDEQLGDKQEALKVMHAPSPL
ncbi:MAG TPA: tetratricopeptide repeat protein [Drouetiella sp.]